MIKRNHDREPEPRKAFEREDGSFGICFNPNSEVRRIVLIWWLEAKGRRFTAVFKVLELDVVSKGRSKPKSRLT